MKPRSSTHSVPLLFVLMLTLASLACGMADLPNPFATPTPTPTLTFTPTATSTPTPTATPTSTPTATATPRPTGVSSELQDDSTTLFNDYDNKYQLVLSQDWVVIPFDKEDLQAMMEKLGQEDPKLAEAAKAFENMDSSVVRMVALNRVPRFFVGNGPSNINITALDDPFLSAMPLAFVTGALEETFTQQGFKVLTTGVNEIENPNGVEVEYIDIEQSRNGLKLRQRLILFQSNDKLIMITVSTLPQTSEEIFELAIEIGASIKLIK